MGPCKTLSKAFSTSSLMMQAVPLHSRTLYRVYWMAKITSVGWRPGKACCHETGRRREGARRFIAMRVQEAIGSRSSAIHKDYRASLRPSKVPEPRYPSLKVVVLDHHPFQKACANYLTRNLLSVGCSAMGRVCFHSVGLGTLLSRTTTEEVQHWGHRPCRRRSSQTWSKSCIPSGKEAIVHQTSNGTPSAPLVFPDLSWPCTMSISRGSNGTFESWCQNMGVWIMHSLRKIEVPRCRFYAVRKHIDIYKYKFIVFALHTIYCNIRTCT